LFLLEPDFGAAETVTAWLDAARPKVAATGGRLT
jgi:hypothetical protein